MAADFPRRSPRQPDVPAPVLPDPGATKDFYIWLLSYTLTNKVFTASHFGRRRPLDFIQKGGRQGEPGLPVFSKGLDTLQSLRTTRGAVPSTSRTGVPDSPAGTSTFTVNSPPRRPGPEGGGGTRP